MGSHSFVISFTQRLITGRILCGDLRATLKAITRDAGPIGHKASMPGQPRYLSSESLLPSHLNSQQGGRPENLTVLSSQRVDCYEGYSFGEEMPGTAQLGCSLCFWTNDHLIKLFQCHPVDFVRLMSR